MAVPEQKAGPQCPSAAIAASLGRVYSSLKFFHVEERAAKGVVKLLKRRRTSSFLK